MGKSSGAGGVGGRLVVISGPSGVGKGTVVAALRQRRPGLRPSVSVTTRPPRPDETAGVHYMFVDDARFDELVRDGGLLEWAEFAGNRYGTPAEPVLRALGDGHDVVLEIDVQGAAQVRRGVPQAILIFLAPPSAADLAARLRARGTEDDGTIAGRLAVARREMEAADHFDHLVVNDRVDEAVDEIIHILETSTTGGAGNDPQPLDPQPLDAEPDHGS